MWYGKLLKIYFTNLRSNNFLLCAYERWDCASDAACCVYLLFAKYFRQPDRMCLFYAAVYKTKYQLITMVYWTPIMARGCQITWATYDNVAENWVKLSNLNNGFRWDRSWNEIHFRSTLQLSLHDAFFYFVFGKNIIVLVLHSFPPTPYIYISNVIFLYDSA